MAPGDTSENALLLPEVIHLFYNLITCSFENLIFHCKNPPLLLLNIFLFLITYLLFVFIAVWVHS